MMKMLMRIQKSQCPVSNRVIYAGAQSNSFNKAPYVMAGYTDFDIMIVGAAGGMCGRAYGNSAQTYIMDKCGGGGGGSLRLAGKLVDLPLVSLFVIGSPGTQGADSTNRGKAGDGTPGGNTYFNEHVAFGGGGAVGGNWDRVDYGGGQIYIQPSVVARGGNGGGNSAGLGTGGAGAVDSFVKIFDGSGFGGDDPGDGGSGPVAGTYAGGGSYPVIGGSVGGGGGKGQINKPDMVWNSTSGAFGASTQFATAGSAGGFGLGGTGGGATVTIITGGNPYDVLGTGLISPQNQGGVAIHVS